MGHFAKKSLQCHVGHNGLIRTSLEFLNVREDFSEEMTIEYELKIEYGSMCERVGKLGRTL